MGILPTLKVYGAALQVSIPLGTGAKGTNKWLRISMEKHIVELAACA